MVSDDQLCVIFGNVFLNLLEGLTNNPGVYPSYTL